MAIDVGIGDLVGSLFFGGDILGAGADAIAAPIAADLGGVAAGAAAADAGALGADLGLTGAAAGAGDLGAVGGDLGVTSALDAGAFGGDVTAALDTLPAGVDIAGLGDLGTPIGGAGDTGFIPTPADTGVAGQGGALASAPGTSSGVPAGASAAGQGGTTSPITDLTTGPQNLNAALGTTPTATPTDVTNITPTSPVSSEIVASANSPAIGQLGAEGGISPATEVALAQAGGAAAAAPPGVGEQIGGALSSASGALSNPLVQLGVPAAMLGYNLLKGPAPIPPQAQQALNNAQANLAPLQKATTENVPLFNQTAATDLNLANSFQISPAQAASIDVWKQGQYNALRQQIANQNPGSPNVESSSEWVQGKNQIDQQALAMQVQMINQLISTAFQAASAANAAVSTSANVTAQFDSTLMQAAQLQVQQDTNFQNAVGSAMQSFGLIAALNAGKFGKNAGATA